jgi:hypothetical protein
VISSVSDTTDAGSEPSRPSVYLLRLSTAASHAVPSDALNMIVEQVQAPRNMRRVLQ